ncbi:MAG: hypothetical protein KKE57_06145 [Proteobacteria bacterium]|nr:hypothetical protein [Pseudomonadota bacterium]
MDTADRSAMTSGFRRTQEKDFPYFRRLWNSVVVALLAASFIPLLLIGGGMYYYTVTVLEEKTMDSLRMEVIEHREAIEAFLAERTMDLKLLSSNLGVDYLTSPGALEKVFQSLQRELPCFTDLGIIDDQGRHLAYVGPYDLLSKNYKDSPWFKAIEARDVYTSDVFLGFRKEPHFIIAVKQLKENGFWIMRATVDTVYFDKMVADVLSHRSGDAFVVNKEGVFQTSPRASGRLMEKWAFRDLEPFEGVRVKEEKGEIFLMAWLERVPWLCVAKFNRRETYRPLRNIRNLGLAILGVSIIVIVFTVFLTTNYLFMRLETKRRNIRFLDQQLRHSSKMASSMKLASGFVQEIGDTLSNIDLVLNWMEELSHRDLAKESNRQEIRESLSQIKSEVARTRTATDKFFKATRPSMPIIGDVNVNNLLDDILELLDRELHFNRIAVKRDYREPLQLIRSDPSQLRQVFQNLIFNAITAIRKDGEITLETRTGEEGVTVQVKDTGPGIPQEMVDKIFDPLYTTKPDGTGLGLSITAGILQKLGGRISVKSGPGKGATFIVELPSHLSHLKG